MTTTTTLPLVDLGDGLTVTALGYGGMSLTDVYGPISEDEGVRTVRHALDAGIRFLDTANVYGGGISERVVGRAVTGRRDEVVIASKFGIAGGPIGSRNINGDPAYMREQLDASLQRLGVERIDLYYQHRIDQQVPIEETVGALAEQVAAGKIGHIGLSEATGDEIRRAARVHPIAAVQSEWSVVSRDVEQNVIPAVIEVGAAFVPYAPLSRAWLTDDFSPAQIGDGDVRRGFPRFTAENLERNAGLRAELGELAAASGLTRAQLALAWLFDRGRRLGLSVAPIPGSRLPRHVDEWMPAADAVGSARAVLSDEVVARLDTFADRISGPRHKDRTWTSQRGDD